MGPVYGMFLGLAFAIGTLMVARQVKSRTITLRQRIAPYLVETDARDRILGSNPVHSPLEVLGRLVAPWFTSLSNWLGRLGSTNTQVTHKLQLAGKDSTVERFRLEQIAWACAGLLTGVVLAGVLALAGRNNPVTLLTVVIICALSGPVFSEYVLTQQIKRRSQRMLMEFPTIAELLALAVSAGESPIAALERVAHTSQGELARELGLTLDQVRSGILMQVALQDLGKRTEVPTIIRFSDSISAALERGTPLAAVLQAQAQDARDAGHRELMEIGGAKELRMLFPVVFLILPITVLFAAFPSIIAFNVSF